MDQTARSLGDDRPTIPADLAPTATLGDLPRLDCVVSPETRGEEVQVLLGKETQLPGVILWSGDTIHGVVSRRRFNEHLGREFGRALFLTRPILEMVTRLNEPYITIPLETRIDRAVDNALDRDPERANEPVVVTGEGLPPTLLAVDTLVRAQSAILKLEYARTSALLEDVKRSENNLRETLDELNRAKDLLVQSEKMAALGQLVAGVAHEINTPIGIALTAVTYLGEQTEKLKADFEAGQMKKSGLTNFMEVAVEISSLIQSNIRRAADLIQSFKQIAVDQTSEAKRSFMFDSFLEELLTSLTPELKRSRHELQSDVAPGIEMQSFPGALGQVLTNLISNAQVHAFADDQSGTIRVTARQSDDMLDLRVSDDGKGIPEEILPKIFDPFFTTRRNSGGSGLGLQIVHSLVTEVLGGTISVESHLHHGTVFELRIPRKAS